MFHRRSLIPLIALSFVLLVGALGGCGGKDEAADSQVLATVGDRVIDVDYFKTRVAKMKPEQLPRTANGVNDGLASLETKREFLDIIIDKELMVSKALQLGYDQDAGVDAALKSLLEYQAMMFFWQDEIGDPSRFVSEEDLDYYYSRLGERRDCRFIIADLEADARQAVAEARAGAPWAEIVAKYHDGVLRDDTLPEIKVPWGQYRDEFEEPIFAVAEGEITEPIPTEHGYWVMVVDKVVQEDKPALESIKDSVLSSIAKRKENLRREALIKRVMEERNYEMNEDALQIIFAGLPEDEPIIDPETGQQTQRDQLQDLDVPAGTFGDVVMSYRLSSGPVTLTVADIKSQFDAQNVFERPKKQELLGGLRSKLRQAAERTVMVDEARQRGYFEDERVVKAAYRQVEEMLVDKLHSEVVTYEEFVSEDEMHQFWAEHEADYENPERRTGQMVVCNDAATAEQAREGLMAGELTWKEANNRFGNNPELAQTFGRFTLIPEGHGGPLHDQLFSLEMDEFSEVFPFEGGFAVVQLTRILPPEDPSFEDRRDVVVQRIKNIRMDEALRKNLADWQAEFGVTVDEELLATMPSWEEVVAELDERKYQAALDAKD